MNPTLNLPLLRTRSSRFGHTRVNANVTQITRKHWKSLSSRGIPRSPYDDS
jgi:hypothetical protein